MNINDLLLYRNKRFTSSFAEHIPGNYRCPYCLNGGLVLDEKTLNYVETVDSKSKKSHPEWEPDWIRYIYSCFFKCKTCSETVSSCGVGHQVYFRTDDPDEVIDYAEFLPKYFYPPINIFQINGRCPDNIKSLIIESFSIAWTDFSAAGNKLRTAIEYLIETQKPELSAIKVLHQKIIAYEKYDPDISTMLLALKWLGNEASHDAVLEECDLTFAYEILETILERLFDDNHSNFKNLIDRINAQKGRPFGR
jgi:hypothetical protein